jgi:hypothetical protein
MPGITTSETKYFHIIDVAESIFAARGLQHNIPSQPSVATT